jgi:hypothetical protein
MRHEVLGLYAKDVHSSSHWARFEFTLCVFLLVALQALFAQMSPRLRFVVPQHYRCRLGAFIAERIRVQRLAPVAARNDHCGSSGSAKAAARRS